MPVFNISPDSEDVAKGDLDYNFSAENLTNVSVTGQNNTTTTPDGGARSALNLNSPSNGNANTSTVGTDGSGKSLVWAWGVTGEEVKTSESAMGNFICHLTSFFQQWNPDMKIGTDWKSLTLPSLLPITIDFFPDHRSLRSKKRVGLPAQFYCKCSFYHFTYGLLQMTTSSPNTLSCLRMKRKNFGVQMVVVIHSISSTNWSLNVFIRECS